MRTIVLVDDVEDNRDFLYYLLSDRFKVIRYSNGQDALASIRNDDPCLILLDISLPDISGFEVLKVIRNDSVLGGVPVLAVTAHAMSGDREKCLSAGFNGYISKPIVNLDEFMTRVESLCESNG